MDPAHEQAEEIFCEALEISAGAPREEFLAAACGSDFKLRAAVEEMLASQADADRFFSGGAALAAGRTPSPTAQTPGFHACVEAAMSAGEIAGQKIGPYQLIERLGEGGCGVVYLARQLAPVQRQVALKLIKPGMDTRNVIARFEAERQALALMDHPHIARVFDAGATDAGRPYFVMELVRGVKITNFCDQERLTPRQRLDLFIQICGALQHAHQKGIIHRDIKPSNILVTIQDGQPTPKVIDFGIAKATGGQRLTDNTVFTACEQFMGTPAYMSPEQADLSGLDVDTRSDIYSLGVLLYELLTGKTPFDQNELMHGGFDEMRRTLRERDPHRPSTRLDCMKSDELTHTAMRRHLEPRRLRSLLSGDLDWIVMKALEKDRKRRYQTANGLAMDVQRFLDDEPVTARPPSRAYRLQKLVRRNRTTFVAAGAVALALLAGFGTSTVLLFREREARHAEALLREEADARAKIAQAAVMLSRDKHAEADALMDKLQIPVTEPSLEAAGVFRALGDWNVTQGRWRTAADRYLKLIQANQVDKTDLTDDATRDLLSAAPALVEAGDLSDYHELVRETILRFAGTTNPVAAEQIIKISGLLPFNEETEAGLVPFAKVMERSVVPPPAEGREAYMTAWRAYALALFEFRRSHFERSVFWAQQCLDYQDSTPSRIAMSHLLLALALKALNQPDRAADEAALGRKMVEARLPDGLAKIPDLGTDSTGIWHDWVMAYFLLNEVASRTPPPKP